MSGILDKPFACYSSKLSELEHNFKSNNYTTNELIFNAVRILNDLLFRASLIFLYQHNNSTIIQLTNEQTLETSIQRLRDAELLNCQENLFINQLKYDCEWLLLTSSRNLPKERGNEIIHFLNNLANKYIHCYNASQSNECKLGCSINGHKYCRDQDTTHNNQSTIIKPYITQSNTNTLSPSRPNTAPDRPGTSQKLNKSSSTASIIDYNNLAPLVQKLEPITVPQSHSKLPFNWSKGEFQLHCAPLPNTSELDLESIESSQDEKDAQAENERNTLIEQRKQIERQKQQEKARLQEIARVKKEKKERKFKKQQENNDDADISDVSDDENDRKVRFEVENKVNNENTKDNIELPIIDTSSRIRIPISFNCIVCHIQLLRAKDIHKIHSNQVYTTKDKKLKTVVTNSVDTWISKPAEFNDAFNSNSDNGEATNDSGINNVDKMESIGVHCSGCNYYVGRFYPSLSQYRLIYIHKLTGQNYMYFTGTIDQLTPNIPEKTESQLDEQDQENNEEQDHHQENGDIKVNGSKSKEEEAIPPIIGVPNSYVNEFQSKLYPYPRFGCCTPYSKQLYQPFQTLFHSTQTCLNNYDEDKQDSDDNDKNSNKNLYDLASTINTNNSFNNSINFNSTNNSFTSDTGNNNANNNNKFKLKLPLLSVEFVISMLKSQSDYEYSQSTNELYLYNDLFHLLLSDRSFHSRRAMDNLSLHVQHFLHNFPSGIYKTTNPSKAVVPIYTSWFIKDCPAFEESRGTARYVFHYLTHKDDSKLKRHKYSYDKFLQQILSLESCVIHITFGGFFKHRLIIVKIGNNCYRILQSNHGLNNSIHRFTCVEWLQSQYKWSRILNYHEFILFLHKFELARRGNVNEWSELFCMNNTPKQVFDPQQDSWDADNDIQYACAKLVQNTVKPFIPKPKDIV